MQNQTEYEIKKLSELNRSQVKQAIALFVDGFYYIYEMAVSKDKALLQQLFIDAFDYDMVFVCLHEERIVGFLGLGNSIKRCVALSKETRDRIREDTELKNFPLFCPKCKKETIINVEQMNITVIKEPDTQMQSR